MAQYLNKTNKLEEDRRKRFSNQFQKNLEFLVGNISSEIAEKYIKVLNTPPPFPPFSFSFTVLRLSSLLLIFLSSSPSPSSPPSFIFFSSSFSSYLCPFLLSSPLSLSSLLTSVLFFSPHLCPFPLLTSVPFFSSLSLQEFHYAHQLNTSLAFFVHCIFLLMDHGYVFSLIKTYFKKVCCKQ